MPAIHNPRYTAIDMCRQEIVIPEVLRIVREAMHSRSRLSFSITISYLFVLWTTQHEQHD